MKQKYSVVIDEKTHIEIFAAKAQQTYSLSQGGEDSVLFWDENGDIIGQFVLRNIKGWCTLSDTQYIRYKD